MNEYGLFYDYTAQDKIDLAQLNLKKPYNGDLFFEILGKCKTVDEALQYLQRHDYAFTSQVLLADETGASIVINAGTRVMKTGEYQININFYIAQVATGNFSCDRYSKANAMLSGIQNVSVASLKNVLNATHQEGNLETQHKDAAHQHLYIVTTIIQANGKRIPTHYFAKLKSEPARQELENDFGLVKASSKLNQDSENIRAADVKKIVYGKSETRRSISNIVRAVTRSYRFTSLPELNAILRQYNVIADRGTERSRMFERKGLIYGLLDEKGKRIGIPVKASSIYGKPTLAFLEKQFALNDTVNAWLTSIVSCKELFFCCSTFAEPKCSLTFVR